MQKTNSRFGGRSGKEKAFRSTGGASDSSGIRNRASDFGEGQAGAGLAGPHVGTFKERSDIGAAPAADPADKSVLEVR